MHIIDEYVERALYKLAARFKGGFALEIHLLENSIVHLKDESHSVNFPIGRVCDVMTNTCIAGGCIDDMWSKLLEV